MAKEMIMPQMGYDMTEGTLLRWLKNVGDPVERGEPIAEIETDKVTIEIEAFDSGVLTETLITEGQTVPVGTPVAKIGEASEVGAAAPAPAKAEAAPAQVAAVELAATEAAPAEAALVAQPAAPISETRPAPAPVTSLPPAEPPSVPGGNGVVSTPIERTAGERLRASPLVKRLAAEHGIDLQLIAGTGPGGRIVKDDVMPYVSGAKPLGAAAPAAAAPTAPTQPALAPVATERPAGTPHDLSRIRRTTGRRMLEAKQTIPHFYVSAEIDMSAAVAVREQINSLVVDDAGKISFNDFVVKATALALKEFPNLNTSYENDQIVEHPNIDINIAVAIEGGLIAPFVPDADQKSLGAIARQAKDMIGRARNGGLQPNEYQGGTFTISNLGMFDVEDFIAVINPPQAAILAVSSIKETPVVENGEVKVGRVMKITVSADHRVTDGAEIARFLQAIKKYLQNPMLLALS
jgi:pyruvate dehydrogenase E2 component (dihydrolipoyllysine-residue acetyltransferase)